MLNLGNGVKKEHLVGIGAVAAGYYLYKKNQNKVDNFLRKQGINVKTSNTANYENMDLESLMTVKEHIEDLIAEKELSAESVSK